MIRYRFAAAVSVATLLLSTFAAWAGQPTGNSISQVIASVEDAAPFSEERLNAALGTRLQRTRADGTTVYRTGTMRFPDRQVIDEVVWLPRSGNTKGTVTIRLPAQPARGPFCIGRGDVSALYGAPIRSWNTTDGNASYTHFEFRRDKGTVSTGFSDESNCLSIIVVTEA